MSVLTITDAEGGWRDVTAEEVSEMMLELALLRKRVELLEKQEPKGYVSNTGMFCEKRDDWWHAFWEPVYVKPVPVKVPDAKGVDDVPEDCGGTEGLAYIRGWNDCRYETVREILKVGRKGVSSHEE